MATVLSGVRPANPLRRLLLAVEPWYNWGRTNISRIDTEHEGPFRTVADPQA
jgi:hypothetical protein